MSKPEPITIVDTTPGRLHSLVRLDWILAACCFCAALALYIRTLAPGVLTGDSVEFQTLSYTLGMSHPPGYPVYLLMGKLFTLLPVGSIAYRVNLLSATFAALAVALLYLNVRLVGGWRLPALAAAYALACTPLFWYHAVVAELYTGAAALIAAEVFLILLWRQKGHWGYLFAAGCLGGLSLGIHSTVVLITPAVLLYLLLTARRRQDWMGALGGAALGLALYAGSFLLLDAINAPSSYYNTVVRPSLSVWGMTPADFDNPFKRMLFQLEARQFRPLMFSQPLDRVWANAAAYFTLTAAPVVLGLWVCGLAALLIRRWREGLLIALSWLTLVVFICNYDILDIVVFYVPTFVPWLLLIAAGWGILLDGIVWLVQRVPLVAKQRYLSLVSHTPAVLLCAGLLGYLSLPVPSYVHESVQAGKLTLPGGELPDTAVAPRSILAGEMMNSLEDNAIVLTKWDTLYIDYYVAHIERGRTGVVFLQFDPQSQAGVSEAAESLLAYIDANLDQRPIYVTERWTPLLQHYKLVRCKTGWITLFQLKRQSTP